MRFNNKNQEANKMEAIKKDELFDEELRGLVKFTDATKKPTQTAEADKIQNEEGPKEEAKTEQKPTNKPMDAEYEPARMFPGERIFNCIKWPAVFAGLEYLVFYWQQTGQMQESAAMPCMIVCALLAGISVGKNWKWRS
jgi:hypothetical protein